MIVSQAYRRCERIVRFRARNFSYGIRLLPAPKRRALSAVYAFARRIDDIGDTDGPAEWRLARLAEARASLHRPVPDADDPVMVALADAARRYAIPLAAFDELIDGCTADVRGATYASFDDLLPYCRCVAGSIGRLSLGVFGSSDPEAAVPLADALGVALQLTNILRDVREDRLAGRVYLPAEDLERFGCTLNLDSSGRFTDPPRSLAGLVRFEADRAHDWYRRSMDLMPLLDRRSAACAAAMAGIYRSLLERIAAHPLQALATTSSLPLWRKATVAAYALAGAGR
ncbi:presqualene diphosphate synthase HpnD [Streptosporangium sp. NPDC051022]|uniref:presqualene diphosphate synthase HpnD n=1 Tax=Streptosporangium sp. NPDC051022 TaxID=3155752 RepID=UPI003443B2CA